MTGQPFLEQTVHLTVEPTFASYGQRPIDGIKITKMTMRKPTGKQVPGTAVIAVRLRIPRTAFQTVRAEVEITVPENLVTVTPILAEAVET